MELILLEFLTNFWELLASIAIYILLGVLLAGVFKYFLPETFIKNHLGSKGFMANIKAAIIGIPLPLCSCSVIPFISSLKKSGASKSAIQTFLISTPITGADSILATYGVMGWLFTAYRTVSSVFIALFAGFLSILFVKEDRVKEDSIKNKPSSGIKNSDKLETSSCCSTTQKLETKISSCSVQLMTIKTEEINSCCSFVPPQNASNCSDCQPTLPDKDQQQSWLHIAKGIVIYAFDDIYKDIAKSLLIGIALGALIMTFMPANLTEFLSNSLLLNYVLVLLIAMPLYVCATSSVPMGLALLAGGFTPGAVFIFLTAGPATNAVTMSVISKTLGKSSLIVYLFSILAGSLFFAFILDVFFSGILTDIMSMAQERETLGFTQQVSAVILLYLSFKYIFTKNTKILSGSCGGDSCGGGGCSEAS
jgi:uncharacterized membrane protein YraQ (UPF0718 family)